jgi:hypothetical protein
MPRDADDPTEEQDEIEAETGTDTDASTTIGIPETATMEYAREDATQTLERVIAKHEGHGKRAIQLVQVNGIVLSILIAAASQVQLAQFPTIFLVIAPLLFLVSGGIALYAYRSQTLPIGLPADEAQKILNHELSADQYLYWYLSNHYEELITTVVTKTNTRAAYVEWAIIVFFVGLLFTTGGIVYASVA